MIEKEQDKMKMELQKALREFNEGSDQNIRKICVDKMEVEKYYNDHII